MTATAEAQPNIALIKYWGKRDVARNIPAVGSISITLSSLRARTSVSKSDGAKDSFELNGRHEVAPALRVRGCLEQLREAGGITSQALAVASDVNFPVAAGLASSAAGFAALVRAADAELETRLDTLALARIAGAASGSAARSLYGGFVRLRPPTDSSADIDVETLVAASHWPLEVVVAITDTGPKDVGSTEAMIRSAETSPYYEAWLATQDADLNAAARLVELREFEQLAHLAETNCLKMHALTLSSTPWIVYFNAATVALIHAVRELRARGTGVFFTVDAGPQLKAVCLPGEGATVARTLEAIAGVKSVIRVGLGDGARVV